MQAPVQVPNKKCGALCHSYSLNLRDQEIITFIYQAPNNSPSGKDAQSKSKAKQHSQYLLVSTLNCVIYVLNFQTRENLYLVDISTLRQSHGHFRQSNEIQMVQDRRSNK